VVTKELDYFFGKHNYCRLLGTEGQNRKISFEEALVRMRATRSSGFRVAVTLGNYDIGHYEHTAALKEFVYATGELGELYVLVGGDREVRLRKGEGRPYQPLEQRMEFVARQRGVRWVVPVQFPQQPTTLGELQECYRQLHLQLGGLVHCRLTGPIEEKTHALYLAQCNEAEILFVHSSRSKTMSATEIGQRIFGVDQVKKPTSGVS